MKHESLVSFYLDSRSVYCTYANMCQIRTEPSLAGFMQNFCDTTSNHNNSPYRPTMTQPYVYWTFNTPFAIIVGLYPNVDGTLDARGTSEQLQWFQQQVKNAPPDKALVIVVHHPPYSLDTSQGGYPDIEVALDRVIQSTGRIPTIVLSGHVHSYHLLLQDSSRIQDSSRRLRPEKASRG